MASTALTQKQRLSQWEAWVREIRRAQRQSDRWALRRRTSTKRRWPYGFKHEKA